MYILAEIVRGTRFRVLALGVREAEGPLRVPFLELRATLARSCPQEERQVARILALAASSGPRLAAHRTKRITDFDFWEFRTRAGTRIFWVYGPDRSVVLLNGFCKKSWRVPKRDLLRAQRWARDFADSAEALLIAAHTRAT